MRFTQQQILAAINNPNYVPVDGSPLFYPLMREVVSIAVAAQYGYTFVSPGTKAVLEVYAIVVSMPGASGINIRILTQNQFVSTTPQASALDGQSLYRVQDAVVSPQQIGQSHGIIRVGNSVNVPVGQSIGRYLAAQYFPLQRAIVLFGDDPRNAPLMGVTAQVANETIGATFMCREWPYDTNDMYPR